jgi:high-affinity iron transporter
MLCSGSAGAQERPAKRVADIVGVALAEYEKGIDSSGRLILKVEFDEAVTFLDQARTAAARLSGAGADSARLALDSLVSGVSRRVPPRSLDPWRDRLWSSLGADARLDMPATAVDVAAGARLYAQHCASCHGTGGMGDGPAGKGMAPPPPALGSAEVMADVQPALMYRIVSIGIAGTPMAGWSERLSVDERWSLVAFLGSLRAPAGGMTVAEGIWLQRCASCHGARGSADGPMSEVLSTHPGELSSFAWQADRSDIQIAAAIRDGIAGTAMPASRDLTTAEVGRLVAWVRALSLGDAPAARGPADPDSVIGTVMRRLQFAIASARRGRPEEAEEQAFSAYIAFERIEGRAWVRDPGLVESLERRFADLRASVAAGDFRKAERTKAAIEHALPAVKRISGPRLSERDAFWTSLRVIIREGVIAALVLGAVVALLVKANHRAQLKSVSTAVGLAIVASGVTVVIMEDVLNLASATRAIVHGMTMLVAAVVLFFVCYRMLSMVGEAGRSQSTPKKIDTALEGRGRKDVILVTVLASYAAATETALRYQALHNERIEIVKELGASTLLGALLLLGFTGPLWKSAAKLAWRPFLTITSVPVFLMGVVLLGKSIRDLHESGAMRVTMLPAWPDVDAMGMFPSVETFVVQLALVALFAFVVMRTFWPSRSVALPTLTAAQPNGVDLHQLMERIDAIEKKLAVRE